MTYKNPPIDAYSFAKAQAQARQAQELEQAKWLAQQEFLRDYNAKQLARSIQEQSNTTKKKAKEIKNVKPTQQDAKELEQLANYWAEQTFSNPYIQEPIEKYEEPIIPINQVTPQFVQDNRTDSEIERDRHLYELEEYKQKQREINEGTANMMFQLPFWVAAPEAMLIYEAANLGGYALTEGEKNSAQLVNNAIGLNDDNIVGDLVVGVLGNAGKNALKTGLKSLANTAPKVSQLAASPYTGKWTHFGDYEYRFKPGRLGSSGANIERREAKNANKRLRALEEKNASLKAENEALRNSKTNITEPKPLEEPIKPKVEEPASATTEATETVSKKKWWKPRDNNYDNSKTWKNANWLEKTNMVLDLPMNPAKNIARMRGKKIGTGTRVLDDLWKGVNLATSFNDINGINNEIERVKQLSKIATDDTEKQEYDNYIKQLENMRLWKTISMVSSVKGTGLSKIVKGDKWYKNAYNTVVSPFMNMEKNSKASVIAPITRFGLYDNMMAEPIIRKQGDKYDDEYYDQMNLNSYNQSVMIEPEQDTIDILDYFE